MLEVIDAATGAGEGQLRSLELLPGICGSKLSNPLAVSANELCAFMSRTHTPKRNSLMAINSNERAAGVVGDLVS
jgi:hypothetical protein